MRYSIFRSQNSYVCICLYVLVCMYSCNNNIKLLVSENRISAVIQNTLIFQDYTINNNLMKVPAIEFI